MILTNSEFFSLIVKQFVDLSFISYIIQNFIKPRLHMKKRLLLTSILTILLSITIQLSAQVGVNIDGSAPDNSAMPDVKSTAKGFLPPRMTTAQRNAIASPAEGLVIYNTDEKTLYVYYGMAWKSMIPTPAFACGLTININHLVSGGVAPVNKTVAYSTVTGIPGEPTKC